MYNCYMVDQEGLCRPGAEEVYILSRDKDLPATLLTTALQKMVELLCVEVNQMMRALWTSMLLKSWIACFTNDNVSFSLVYLF